MDPTPFAPRASNGKRASASSAQPFLPPCATGRGSGAGGPDARPCLRSGSNCFARTYRAPGSRVLRRRSEERRGGEEGRSRGAPDHLKKKKKNKSWTI